MWNFSNDPAKRSKPANLPPDRLLPRSERYELMDDIFRLTAERDEAREWARKYKRQLDVCKDEAYALINENVSLEMGLNSLRRKYAQATCEHPWNVSTFYMREKCKYTKCDDCGQVLDHDARY